MIENNRCNIFPKLINEMGLKKGVEIGVNYGSFSSCLLKNSKLEKLWCVDIWNNEDIFNKAKTCLSQYPNCAIIKLPSMEAVKKFRHKSLDFVYIDAEHSLSAVYNDIVEWGKRVRSGGLLGGHDLDAKFLSQVKPAVEYYCQKFNYTYNHTDERIYKSWWFIKR